MSETSIHWCSHVYSPTQTLRHACASQGFGIEEKVSEKRRRIIYRVYGRRSLSGWLLTGSILWVTLDIHFLGRSCVKNSPDTTLCGWLRSKHKLTTNKLTVLEIRYNPGLASCSHLIFTVILFFRRRGFFTRSAPAFPSPTCLFFRTAGMFRRWRKTLTRSVIRSTLRM